MRLIGVALAFLATAAVAATITSVGPMVVARDEHTATLLPDGTVLIAGGVDFMGPDIPLKEEIYDPHTRQFHAISGMISPRLGHAAVSLPDGRVLLVGGVRAANANSEIFNPATTTFTSLASISGERYELGSVLLSDGRVLAVGGKRSGTDLASAETFNPASGGWAFGGLMNMPRSMMPVVRMKDGRVLVGGGGNASPVEIFDPATGNFTTVPNTLVFATRGVLLPSGKVLLVGLGYLQTFDPSTQTATITGPRLKTYRGEAVVLLPNGKVLIAGGNIDGTSLSDDVLLYSPDTSTVASIGKLTVARDSATGTLLPDGTVLIAGGYTLPGFKSSAAAEIIDLRPRSRAVHH
jgi:hypothetical protein